MSFSQNDSRFMARAIQLAQRGWYTTRSNPRVGCVLVKDLDNTSERVSDAVSDSKGPQVIGQGWHQKPGLAHAEVNAIADARANNHDVSGATAYVTLEPCSHFGKTPPCAQGLIDAGVERVVCAMTDPNPQVSGLGIAMLQDAGIEVRTGLMEQEARELNLGFIKRMTTGLPRVNAKIAISVDGRTAMASGESQWITGPEARQEVQRLRAESGAIITGSKTVMTDNPSMNVRAEEFVNNSYFEQPLRVVVDSQGIVEPSAQLFANDGDCLIVGTRIGGRKDGASLPSNVTHKALINAETGKVDLKLLLQNLAKQGINDVLLESGSDLLGAFLQKNLVDQLTVFMAPKLLGASARPLANLPFDSMAQNIQLELTDVRQIGQDLKLTYKRVDK